MWFRDEFTLKTRYNDSMKWYYWVVGGAAAALIVATVIRVITPQPVIVPETPQVTSNVGGLKTNFSGLRYVGPDFKKPAKLPIAPASVTANQTVFLNQLIQNLNLKPHQVIPDFWENEKYTLSFLPEAGTATLTEAQLSLQPVDDTGATLTEAAAIEAARDFIAEHFPSLTNMTPQTKDIVYLRGDADAHRSTVEEAHLAVIPFAPTIENLPVFIGSTSNFPLEVFVARDLSVRKVVFSPTSLQFEPSAEADIISIDEALKNINTNQKAAVTQFSNIEVGTTIDLSDIVAGQLSEVFLEYRLDSELQVIYPFYRFRGRVENAAGDKFEIELVTPAVVTQAPL
jgi:hypothetical protein